MANEIIFGEDETVVFVGGLVKRSSLDSVKYNGVSRIADDGTIDWTYINS
jgi:hypothetical protein